MELSGRLESKVQEGVVAVADQSGGGDQQQHDGSGDLNHLHGDLSVARLQCTLLETLTHHPDDGGTGQNGDDKEQKAALEGHIGLIIGEAVSVEPEQALQNSENFRGGLEAEDHPAEGDNQESVQPGENRGAGDTESGKQIFFSHQEQEVVQTPEQEIPTGAVPETGQGPDDQQVEDVPSRVAAVSAQRDVKSSERYAICAKTQ